MPLVVAVHKCFFETRAEPPLLIASGHLPLRQPLAYKSGVTASGAGGGGIWFHPSPCCADQHHIRHRVGEGFAAA